MLFNSLAYLFFLPSVVVLYYLLPQKLRWLLLLGASYFFYGSWKVEYLSLILLSTLVDYFVSNYIARQTTPAPRKWALAVSIAVNVGVLFTFKYFNFFLEETLSLPFSWTDGAFWQELRESARFVLPVGISFYTFQTMGYTIDVYRGNATAEKDVGKFALFVSFFPQLVAGPIERYSKLQPQLAGRVTLDYDNLSNGFRLLLYGLFVKMAVADNLATYVNAVYAQPEHYQSGSVLLAMAFFGLQIYADFHGYSLIAIGSARLLGIRLMDNFRAPYWSASVTEFWQRWHISLSTWFRDYVYIPLGGNRVNRGRWAFNILAVFTISGFWHGANWTFLIWGALHGGTYLLERFVPFLKGSNAGIFRVIGTLKTYVVVTLAWVFFRADSLPHALDTLQAVVTNLHQEAALSVRPEVWVLLSVFLISDRLFGYQRFDRWCEHRHWAIRWGSYALLLAALLGFSGTDHHPFIYFQF